MKVKIEPFAYYRDYDKELYHYVIIVDGHHIPLVAFENGEESWMEGILKMKLTPLIDELVEKCDGVPISMDGMKGVCFTSRHYARKGKPAVENFLVASQLRQSS